MFLQPTHKDKNAHANLKTLISSTKKYVRQFEIMFDSLKICSAVQKYVRQFKNMFDSSEICLTVTVRKYVRQFENMFDSSKICSTVWKYVRQFENMYDSLKVVHKWCHDLKEKAIIVHLHLDLHNKTEI